MAKIATLFDLTEHLPPANQTKVLVTGFFDLFHREHRRFLKKAKSEADFLIVGVESDLRARLLKGSERPYQPQSFRVSQLAKLETVDLVVFLPLNFYQSNLRKLLLDLIKPQILAVSSHSPNLEQKRLMIEQFGGKLKVVHQHNPQVSTTILAKKLYNQVRR